MNRKKVVFISSLIIGIVFAFNATLVWAKDMTAQDLVEEAKQKIVMISVEEAEAMFVKGGVIFLDCREPKEYKSGHIPTAINIPRGRLEFDIGNEIPDKSAPIVMYCKTGGRGCLACYSIVRMGYTNVKNMEGGWKAWVKSGYPVE